VKFIAGILLVFLPLMLSVLAVELPSILIVNGQTYNGVTYQSHSASRLNIMHESGVASLPIGSLSADLREQLGYSEEAAKAAEREAAEAQAQAQVTRAEQARAIAAKQRLEKIGETISSTIFQVVPDGVLVDSTVYVKAMITNTETVSANNLLRPEATKTVVTKREGVISKILSEGDYVFVRTEQRGLIDGAQFTGTVYPIGTYTYKTVTGASKTLHAFTDIPGLAESYSARE